MCCRHNIYIQIKMFSITETTKDKKCLLFDEYRFHHERIRNTTSYWRCAYILVVVMNGLYKEVMIYLLSHHHTIMIRTNKEMKSNNLKRT